MHDPDLRLLERDGARVRLASTRSASSFSLEAAACFALALPLFPEGVLRVLELLPFRGLVDVP